jgi:putative flavoprotein involved in K+ transport
MTDYTVDILVVSAGQAGLAIGYHLKQAGYPFQLVERNARVGDNWRNRYDSLVLFTPRAYSALPGPPVPDYPYGYRTKDESADYLEQYDPRSRGCGRPLRPPAGCVATPRPLLYR